MSDKINPNIEASALTTVPGEGVNTVVPIAPEAGNIPPQESVYNSDGELIEVRDIQS
ncbi:MAG: hypothetical protein RLY61_313 [Candidatus Parcubacteria bacterium]